MKEQFPYYSVEMEMLVNKLSSLYDEAEKLEHEGHMICALKGMGAFLEGVADEVNTIRSRFTSPTSNRQRAGALLRCLLGEDL